MFSQKIFKPYLRMPNIMQLIFLSVLQSIIYHGWQVPHTDLFETEIEERVLLKDIIRVQSDVATGVLVSSGISHPNVEAGVY